MKNLIILLVMAVSLPVVSAQTTCKLSSNDSLNLLIFKSKMEKISSDLNETKLVFSTLYQSNSKYLSRSRIKKERLKLKELCKEFNETFLAFQTFARSCDKEHEFGPRGWCVDPLSLVEFSFWQVKNSLVEYDLYLGKIKK